MLNQIKYFSSKPLADGIESSYIEKSITQLTLFTNFLKLFTMIVIALKIIKTISEIILAIFF